VATNGDLVAFILRDDVAWLDHVEDDKQQKTAANYWRKLSEAKKAKKIE